MVRAALGLVCLSAPGCAGIDTEPSELVPVRSTLLDDTGTVTAGGVDVEAGALVDPGHGWLAPAAVKWGAGPATELFGGLVAYRRRSGGEQGVGNAELGVRHRFADETATSPAALFRLAGLLPVGDPDVRAFDEPGGIASISVTKTIAGIALHPTYQVIAVGASGGSGVDVVQGVGALVSGAVTAELFLFGEVAGFFGPHDDEQLFVQLGCGLFATDRLALDFGVIRGFGDDVDDLVLSFGATLSFGGGVGDR